MPATVTHAFFAEDIYEKLDIKYQKKINKKQLLMFSQSMDSMMFYNILDFKRDKKVKNFSKIFHTENVNKYFSSLLNYIKINKYYNDPQTLTYVYGLICHFVLDSTLHPFIFYKTGLFNKKDKKTYKYNGFHNRMETYIDNVMLSKKRYNYKKLNFKNLCFDFKHFSEELKKSIKHSFKEVYNIENMDKIYYNSLKQMNFILQLLRFDKHGLKKFFYKSIDRITPKNMFRLETLSYYKIENKYDYLNLNKKEWYNSTNKNIKSNKNFFELYDDSIITCLNIITNINNYFFNNSKLNIENLFKNKSYITGLDCDKTLELKYFEF